MRIWWSYLSFSQYCIYFPGDFIRFARRELLVSETILLYVFPRGSCSKTNRIFNRRLFLLKKWINHALTMHSTMNLSTIYLPIYFDLHGQVRSRQTSRTVQALEIKTVHTLQFHWGNLLPLHHRRPPPLHSYSASGRLYKVNLDFTFWPTWLISIDWMIILTHVAGTGSETKKSFLVDILLKLADDDV